MFGEGNYSLGIPLETTVVDRLQNLILAILEKETSLGLTKEITKIIQVKGEFHVTLGVFHPGIFQTNRGLFERIIAYLIAHKQEYNELKTNFFGKCKIYGIGYDETGITNSNVVWATIESAEIGAIRSRIHALLKSSEIPESNFAFTDPHVTLFIKTKDQHGIPKLMKDPLTKYIKDTEINFQFGTVAFYNGPKVLASFGPKIAGTPSISFSKLLKEAVGKKEVKGMQYNWGSLFRNPKYKVDAAKIKNLFLTEGNEGLIKAGYDANEISNLIQS
jgi:hypothetical protein